MNAVLLVHYTEIGTKGKNRGFFERRLREALQRRLIPRQASRVTVEEGRVVADLAPDHDPAAVRAAMAEVFGVAWYAFAASVERDWEAILAAGLDCARARPDAKTFKVYCNRVDKTFPMTSQEVCNRLGQAVVDQFKLKVNLDAHDLGIHVDIMPGNARVYGEKVPGQRGMPQGSAGRLLCLFSGGIDSPVAAWSLMRRGALVHLLHFHPFRRGEDVRETKIFALHARLRAFNPGCLLFLIPHYHYQVKAALEIPHAYEMVLFRRFMFRAAVELAKKRRFHGLITGDSLGQVASQTAENIAAAQGGLELPFYMPLISLDKEEIIRTAQRIGTYEPSILPYKDCCSLMSRHPKTMVAVERIRRLEESLRLEEIIAASLGSLEVWNGEALTSVPLVDPSAAGR